ncbi:MAG TPA: hypothetical protein DG942_04415 [Ruminococcaceae bacterium]|jgi:phosphoglycolate phosphatase|nr:hypothetical protein [Oscillospiraceae bacterium]
MKPKYLLVLFDLDGTLTDSGPGIIASVRYALEQMKKPIPPCDVLRQFIGPPLFDSFTKFCGMSERETEKAIDYFHRIYNSNGVYNNSVYPGIPEMLEDLRRAGSKLAIVTSKPRSMAKLVLKHFGLLKYFSYFSTADESDKGGGKETLIRPILETTGCKPSDAMMIGDTKFDAAGARKAGTSFLGVLYGFGKEDEMRREGGRVFVTSPAEIADALAAS